MKSVNLIPAPRRDAKRRRKHRKICAAACGAYALLLAGALGAAHIAWSGVGASLDEQLGKLDTSIERAERQASDARTELATARATIEANRTVAEQPDWSVLLALLATTTGDDVVLRGVSITQPATTAASGAAAAKSPAPNSTPEVLLELNGIGRSQLAVQQHVLRLEQTGLFSKVALMDTGREPYLEADAIAFRLQCAFGEPKQPKPTALSATDAGGITR
jgi:hypothetical protein